MWMAWTASRASCIMERSETTVVNKRETGRRYEDMAEAYLKEQGYRILERNYHNRFGEVDILAVSDGVVVACEVKYRSGRRYGDPSEAVDLRKQKKICRTVLYYFARHGYQEDTPCRFDVIAVYGDDTIRHLENAFEFID